MNGGCLDRPRRTRGVVWLRWGAMIWKWIGIGALVVGGVAGVACAQRFSPGVEVVRDLEGGQFELARGEMEGGRFAEAYGRLMGVVGKAGGGGGERVLAGGDAEGGWGSVVVGVAGYFAELPESWREGLGKESAGEDKRELEAVKRKEGDVEDYLRLARRWPVSLKRGEMLAGAGRALRARGDFVSAGQVEARGKGEAAGGEARQERALVEYWWFGKLPDRLGGIRAVPVVVGDVVYAGSATHVVAMHGDGSRGVKLDWVWPGLNLKRGEKGEEWRAGRLDFPSFEPAVWKDEAGRARAVVARMIGDTGAGVVRALRAADGKVLWGSDGEGGEGEELNYCSSPAVMGGYVYVLATSSGAGKLGGERAGVLELVGLDLMSGRRMFRTRLGDLSEVPKAGRGKKSKDVTDLLRGAGLWDEMSPVAVVGDRVYVSPGGAVFQVDRFDGSLVRAFVYPTLTYVAKEGNMPAELPASRWDSTGVVVGKSLVFAPRDTEDLFALDRETMRPVWRVKRMGAYTVIGVSGEKVILQGRDEVVALDGGSGKEVWSVVSRTNSQFTGPGVVRGGAVVLPTSKGVMALEAGNGKWMEAFPGGIVELRPWLSGEMGAVLRGANLMAAWRGAAKER